MQSTPRIFGSCVNMEGSQNQADDLTAILNRLGDKIDKASDNTVNIVKAEIAFVKEEISDVKSKLATLDANITQLGARLTLVEQEQTKTITRIIRVEREAAETNKSVTSVKSQIQNELKEEIAQLKCASCLELNPL